MLSLITHRRRSHDVEHLRDFSSYLFHVSPVDHAIVYHNMWHRHLTRRPFMASLPQRRPRSHNSIFLSYDELRAVSFEIKPHATSHASPCGTRARTQLAHKILPTLRDIGARFVAQYIYVKCYSSLTDSVNTTSNIAIPYDSAFS